MTILVVFKKKNTHPIPRLHQSDEFETGLPMQLEARHPADNVASAVVGIVVLPHHLSECLNQLSAIGAAVVEGSRTAGDTSAVVAQLCRKEEGTPLLSGN